MQIESMAITVIGDARGQPVAAGRSRAPAILRGRVTTARNTPGPRLKGDVSEDHDADLPARSREAVEPPARRTRPARPGARGTYSQVSNKRNNMKFRHSLLSVSIASALALLSQQAAQAADATDVKVGFAAPLTGVNAGYGKDLQN
ncbi:hypothetical protein KPA97_16585, partial [Burkholderia cenocepacia]|nr:hypothetical protein [Burkholderia cenocepacia]